MKLYLIDGNNIIHRAYHAIAPLITSSGEQTNAVYGTLRTVLKIVKKHSPDYLAVCMDFPAKNIRHKEFPQYKATRKEKDDALKNQFPLVKEFIKAFKWTIFEIEGYEADDIIASLVERYKNKVDEIIIVTKDKDAMQLVSGNVKVYDDDKEIMYDEKKVSEKYGVAPKCLVDYFALVGDKSDNIPGVKNIGEVTASKMLQDYGTVDKIYENLDKIPEKMRQNLVDNKALAYLSRRLISLLVDAPLNIKLEDLKIKELDGSKLLELMRKYEFKSLLNEVKSIVPKLPASDDYDKKIIYSEKDLDLLVADIKSEKVMSVDLETTSVDFMTADIVGVAVSTNLSNSFYIPCGHNCLDAYEQINVNTVIEKLRTVLTDANIKKYGHNLKYELLVFKKYGLELNGIFFDTMLASYCLNPSKQTHNLKSVVFEVLGAWMTEIEELLGKGKKAKTMADVEIASAAEYAMADSHYVLQLADKFENELKEKKLFKLFSEVEMPLMNVVAKMEELGIEIDVDYLKKLSSEFAKKISNIETSVYELAGQKFNLNSPKQLSTILFEKLKLPVVRRTKTGFSTDEEVLKTLSAAHKLPQLIIEHREIAKLKSTYADALISLSEASSRRVHTNFNQTVTATGRLSSSEPNLQNIPIKTEEGRKIRKAFIAKQGCLLLSADYSQIDLRVLAHLSQDKNLIGAFKEGGDIHEMTAMELFGVKEVSKELRRIAKTINFGIVYGMSAYGLSQSLGISQADAAKYIEDYFSKYSGVKEWTTKIIASARKNGYVETLLNRIRYVSEVNSKNDQIRSAAERMAINTPVQGTSADIIKVAMLNLDKKLSHVKTDAALLLQVHDELLFEIAENKIKEISAVVKKEMEFAIKLDVPIVVDIKVGKNWNEMDVIKI